jgi:hypothetical protein
MAIVMMFLAGLLCSAPAAAQSGDRPDPRRAFLQSLVMPGWGHYYADRDNWNRGKVHLGTDVTLALSAFGLHAHSNRLEERYLTLSGLRAGVDLEDRGRSFRLAVADFNSLEEYNDYQLRSRNWDRLIEDTPENRWQWDHPDDRQNYRELRSRTDRVRSQIPALLGLMVVNRVVSGISAYQRASDRQAVPEVSFMPTGSGIFSGVAATFHYRF